jgi:hypothetical protein
LDAGLDRRPDMATLARGNTFPTFTADGLKEEIARERAHSC